MEAGSDTLHQAMLLVQESYHGNKEQLLGCCNKLLQQAIFVQSNAADSVKSNMVLANLLERREVNCHSLVGSIRGSATNAATVLKETKSTVVLFNITSLWFTSQQYALAKPLLDHLCSLSPTDGPEISTVVLAHLLRLELLVKVLQSGRYQTPGVPDMDRAEITGAAKASEEALLNCIKLRFHGKHVASIPAGADLLRLNMPTCTSSTPIQETWSYGGSALESTTTAYGYELLTGLVVLLRLHVCMARLHIATNGMNDAKIHLRHALDIYSRYLRHAEQALLASDHFDVDLARVPTVFALIALVGSLKVPNEDSSSVVSQIRRHHRLVTDVLAEYYFRSRSYGDALNSLCGSLSVQPLALHTLVDRLHLPPTGEVGVGGIVQSRLNNAACALLRSDKPSMAVLLLRQGLEQAARTAPSGGDGGPALASADSDVALCSDSHRGSLRRHTPVPLQYNLALALLRQGRPLEALAQLRCLHAIELEGKPYIWLRRAECCILHAHLLTTTVDPSRVPVVAQLVGQGDLQKVQVECPSVRRPDATTLTALVEHALAQLAQNGAQESYLTSCVQYLQAGEGYGSCPLDGRQAYLLSALVHSAGLSRAADYLGTALGIVNRALKRLTAATDATPEAEKSLLALKSAALLKLSYVQLMQRNPHSALIASQELRQLPSTAMTEHHRHLATFYHVEILCRLGSEHEAAVLLKASANATIAAWQTALASSTGGGWDSGNDAERKLGISLPAELFFSGAARLKELSSASPGQLGVTLKLLHRVNDAVVLLLRAETDAARVILEDVVRTDRDLVPAVQNLLYVYVRQGKSAEALALLRLVNCLPRAG